MIDLDKVEFSTKPYNLRELILAQQVGTGDWVATFDLIVARSSIAAEEALELDQDELAVVLNKLIEAGQHSIVLQELGKGLGDVSSK